MSEVDTTITLDLSERTVDLPLPEKGENIPARIRWRPIETIEYIAAYVDQSGQSTEDALTGWHVLSACRQAKVDEAAELKILKAEIQWLANKIETMRWGGIHSGIVDLITEIREKAQ